MDVRFPLNIMTVVTGVSGSGKSTLVRDVFYKALKREYSESSERPGEFVSISGDIQMVKDIEFVDQNPIGKSSRSNPVTYVKAYDEIRKLYAEQPWPNKWVTQPDTFHSTPKEDVVKNAKATEQLRWRCSLWPTWCWNVNLVTASALKAILWK